MSAGQSLADLLMKIGVDADAMTSGFQSANAQTRRMAKDMVDGINASFQKVQTPTIIGSDRAMADRLEFYKKKLEEGRISQETFNKAVAAARRAFESQENGASATAAKLSDLIDLQEKYRASVALMQRETTQNANAMQSAMIRGMSSVGQLPDKLIAGMSESGRLATSVQESLDAASEASTRAAEEELDRRQESINAVNAQRSAARDLAAENARVADDYSGLVQQMQQAEIQARRLARGRSLDAKLAEEAARSDQQQQQQRAALAASLADGEERQRRRIEAAAKVQARLDEDSQRIKQAGADQAVERAENERAINAAVSSESVRQTQAERDVQNLLNQQLERGNEALQFRNRLRREAVAFAQALDEAGITPGSQRYQNLTQEFRESQQRQEEEFRNRDQINDEIERRNQLDQQAARVIRSVTTAEEAHNQRLTQLRILHESNRISTEQYNRAVRESINVMNSQRAGFSQTSGILAQLSFGMEDFAQGLAMGDLRAAMLGASNNIGMVVRGLRDMDQESRRVTFSVIRQGAAFAGLIGAGAAALALVHYTKNLNTELKSLADRIAEATRQYYRFEQANELATRQERRSEELKNIETIEGIDTKRRQTELEHADMMRRLDTERLENNVRGREAIMKMLGGEANFIQLQQHLQSKGTQESQIALEQLTRAQTAALKGNTEVAFNEMKMLFQYLDREAAKAPFAVLSAIKNVDAAKLKEFGLFDMAALNELQKYFKQGSMMSLNLYGDSEEALSEIRAVLDDIAKDESKAMAERKDAALAMEEIDKRAAELAAQRKMDEEHLAKLEADKLEMRHQAAKFDAETVRLRQEEELFLIKATDQEKELYRLRKEQQAFVRPQAAVVGLDPLMNALMAQGMADTQQADQMAFLEAQKQAAQNEMQLLMEQAIPKAQGALEQNAFQAQADAFKQMTENIAQKPNPQLTQVVNKLKAIEDAIKNGGSFVQVGP